MPDASLGPTSISQPSVSCNFPDITATSPGMINFLCFTFVSTWASAIALATTLSFSLSPEYAVNTEVPPVSTDNIYAGIRLPSNFSLTYYTVEGEVEGSRIPAYILSVDTGGTSVLTAYSGDKLNDKVVAKAMADAQVETKVKHRKLIIPGLVGVMSGK